MGQLAEMMTMIRRPFARDRRAPPPPASAPGAPAWTPAALGSPLVLWLDAQDTTTLYTDTTESALASNGVTVGRWKDKSGNNKHADQATSTKRPTRSDTGINSKTALSYDGGDGLGTVAMPITGQQLEIYCVAKSSSNAANQIFVEALTAYYALFATTTSFLCRCAGNVGNNSHNTTTRDTIEHIFRATFDLSLASLEATLAVSNGTYAFARTESANNTSSFVSQSVYIGNRTNSLLFLTGAIGEVIMINGLLSAQDATKVSTYLSTKWGIP